MGKTYQANHFTGEQLDGFMQKVLEGELAGRGMAFDESGVLHCTVPGYSRLVYSYTHTTNKEVHATALDPETGIFTAPGHGMSNRQMIQVTVHPPYNVGAPYEVLPGGLVIGATGNVSTSQSYYAQVIDGDTFKISTTSTGTPLTFTENPTMDFSKFHFEVVNRSDLTIEDLNLRECLVIVRGKVRNAIRWIHPTNALKFGNSSGDQTGSIAYDGAFGTDALGSCFFGRPGYNYTYATLEFIMPSERQVLQIFNVDYVNYSETGVPAYKHNRQYFHRRLDTDIIEGITMYGDSAGGFYNGTTVEVYAK